MKISSLLLFWNIFSLFPTSTAFSSIHSSTSTATCLGMSSSSSTPSPMEDAKKLISKAISIGAPAYNAGDIQECARVYKTAATQISSFNMLTMLPSSFKNELEQAIQTEYDNDNEQAWAFRKQFDGIMEYQIPFMPMLEASTKEYTFEKFTNGMILPSQPMIVNDDVMGGISQATWDTSSSIFKGNTSLANNGGFASLRWRMSTVQNLSYAKGIYLKITHSNPSQHTFRLIVKDTTCGQVRGANFKNIFANPLNQEGPILIPFEAFDEMEAFGRALMGPVLNRGAVTELGLMAIKPTVVGEFELKIVEWGLYV